MTEPAAKEPQIAGKKGHLFCRMQISQNLLLVVPLRAPYLKTYLPEMNPPAAELFDLVFGDIVIEKDQAAVFLAATSFTTPRRVSDTASRTACELMIPRYCLATASGV